MFNNEQFFYEYINPRCGDENENYWNNDFQQEGLMGTIKEENQIQNIPIDEIKDKIRTDIATNPIKNPNIDSNLNFQKEINSINIPNNNYKSESCSEESIHKKKKILGRKKKNSNEKGIHTKYSEDNIIRKIKSTILSFVIQFINTTIYSVYNGKIGKGKYMKELKKNNKAQINDTNGNKIFLHKNLGDIFSEDISTKYCNFANDHNKKLIKKLLSEKEGEKRILFEKLFSLTFLDCLSHIRGSKYYPELEGIETLDDILQKFEEDADYYDLFKYYIFNFEKIVMNKKTRISRKNKLKIF